jgi:3-methyladenine DNA glycosylase Tag
MGFCGWADVNERNKVYHDNEWDVPVHDDRNMFGEENLPIETGAVKQNVSLTIYILQYILV